MEMAAANNPYFRTYTGKLVHIRDPHPDEVDIEDIAHALSQTCRFFGHTDGFYSVAQHSVLVSQRVPPADALWGLLHDGAEAYLGDLARPLKRAPEMEWYRSLEDRFLVCFAERFGLPPGIPESVVRADSMLLATEFRDVTTVHDDHPWIVNECGVAPINSGFYILPCPPAVAEDRFLRRYWELTK
jgi:hypothetical protein